MKILLPYGKGQRGVEIPSENFITLESPQAPRRIQDLEKASRQVLREPNGTRPLREIVENKKKVCIVMNDLTRPRASHRIVRPVLAELRESGVRNENVVLLIGTGLHRTNTDHELRQMLGELPNELRVINHDSRDWRNMVSYGTTKSGTPIEINRVLAEADMRILTGYISPHQQAGFTGGRKSVLPGVASYGSIKIFHSFPICPREVALGVIDGNPTHTESLEAARKVGVDFIVNVVTDSAGEVFKIVAGDLEKAWLDGVRAWRQYHEANVSEFSDISIVSPGGYPRDINFWQSQKAIAAAELITKKSGIIILLAECPDGLGEEHLDWYQWLTDASTPEEVIERFDAEGFVSGSSKAFLFARALKDFEVFVVSDNLDPRLLAQMGFVPCATVDEALEKALSRKGHHARVVTVPRAVEYLPSVKHR